MPCSYRAVSAHSMAGDIIETDTGILDRGCSNFGPKVLDEGAGANMALTKALWIYPADWVSNIFSHNFPYFITSIAHGCGEAGRSVGTYEHKLERLTLSSKKNKGFRPDTCMVICWRGVLNRGRTYLSSLFLTKRCCTDNLILCGKEWGHGVQGSESSNGTSQENVRTVCMWKGVMFLQFRIVVCSIVLSKTRNKSSSCWEWCLRDVVLDGTNRL